MDDFRAVPVPADPNTIEDFFGKHQSKYVDSYGEIKRRILKETADLGIYTIYGRDQRQGGKILKDPRKVRLKFNSFYEDKKSSTGSIWDIPDIIGFTIVVAYPSEISKVCSKIDQLIESGFLRASYPSMPPEGEDSDAIIKTKHGRSIVTKGYFACHYNVTENRAVDSKSPICEIQIKTLLHDAWGAKTHDLTYKTAGQVDQALVKSFELLGDSLAKLDQQSDLIRNSIEVQLSVRKRKKAAILDSELIAHFSRAIADSSTLKPYEANLLSVSRNSDDKALEKLSNHCINEFKSGVASSGARCLFFVGHLSGSERIVSMAREALQSWELSLRDPMITAHAIGLSGLMSFFSGDTEYSIDENRRAIDVLNSVSETSLSAVEKVTFLRRKHSLYSSLGYYYAEIIGSHVGDKLNAKHEAKKALEATLKVRRRVKDCPNSALINFKIIKKSLKHPTLAWSNFSSLDNELFVRSQLADTIEDLKVVRIAMAELHKNPPPSHTKEADLLFDFHDHCARMRLMDIEKGYTG